MNPTQWHAHSNYVPPQPPYPPSHSLPEVSTTAQAGSSVLTVRATDRDSGNFGLVSSACQSACLLPSHPLTPSPLILSPPHPPTPSPLILSPSHPLTPSSPHPTHPLTSSSSHPLTSSSPHPTHLLTPSPPHPLTPHLLTPSPHSPPHLLTLSSPHLLTPLTPLTPTPLSFLPCPQVSYRLVNTAEGRFRIDNATGTLFTRGSFAELDGVMYSIGVS